MKKGKAANSANSGHSCCFFGSKKKKSDLDPRTESDELALPLARVEGHTG